MAAITSYRARSVWIVAPARGEEIVAAAAEALASAAVGHAWIVGRGTLDEVELEEAGARRTFATPMHIVALEGRAHAGGGEGALVFSATVARSTPRGVELLVGDVVRAIARDVELLVTPLAPMSGDTRDAIGDAIGDEASDDETPEKQAHSAPARAAVSANDPWSTLAHASAEAHAPPPALARAPARAPAVAPSRSVARAAPPPPVALAPPAAPPAPPRRAAAAFEETYPEPGDLLDHFAFGRCIVLRSDGDELLVQHPTSGRTRTLRLSALQAAPPKDEDGKRLFKLTQRRG